MKYCIYLSVGLLAILAIAACARKSSSPSATAEQATTPAPVRPSSPEPKPEAYQVVGFQKTACFGKCPVYQVKIYNDGEATWHGQMNVDRIGWHRAKISKETLQAIRSKADETGFWDMAGEYPQGYKIADLPSTVTYLRRGDTEKIIVNTHQAPDQLIAFEDYLEEVILSLDWKPSVSK